MKPLIRIILIFFAIFTLMMASVKAFGLFTLEDIESWLAAAKQVSPIWVSAMIIGLLFVDLFIAVPTLSITILSGYFLGWPFGAFAPLVGMFSAAVTGFFLSRIFGDRILKLLVRKDEERKELAEAFDKIGFSMIVVGRAVPMLPEASACLAGATNMPFLKFLTAWLLGTVPYGFLASYSGSVSSLDDPMPAILVALAIPASLSAVWILMNRKSSATKKQPQRI